jgi:RNA polymerase sigma factor (sigma-70 family)
MSRRSVVPTKVERAAEVFDEHGAFIRSVIRFHTKNEQKTEDLFQDFFLFLVAKPIPQEVQNVKGFLYKLITDLVKDSFRRIDCYHATMRRYAERHVRTIEKRPENVIMEIEETKKMFESIEKRLPPPQALAVTLKYRDSCDTGEVAKKMHVKPRSVSRYVSVGLEKLRCVLDEEQRGHL